MFDIINFKFFKMKKILPIIIALFFTVGRAQEEFYVGLHYFTVKKQYVKEFIDQEKNYYSKMQDFNRCR